MEPLMTKIVDFDRYCSQCKYFEKTEDEHPCDRCLTVPAREGTRKPLHFKEKDR